MSLRMVMKSLLSSHLRVAAHLKIQPFLVPKLLAGPLLFLSEIVSLYIIRISDLYIQPL